MVVSKVLESCAEEDPGNQLQPQQWPNLLGTPDPIDAQRNEMDRAFSSRSILSSASFPPLQLNQSVEQVW